jgi:hypothetical protein
VTRSIARFSMQRFIVDIVHLEQAAVCSNMAADPSCMSRPSFEHRGAGRESGYIVVSLLQLLSLVEIRHTWYTSFPVQPITNWLLLRLTVDVSSIVNGLSSEPERVFRRYVRVKRLADE